MDAYRISEAEADWPALIDRAASGEPVVITRDGKPVAELRPVQPTFEPSEALRRLDELRESLPPSDISSVDLLDQIREERELSVAGLFRR